MIQLLSCLHLLLKESEGFGVEFWIFKIEKFNSVLLAVSVRGSKLDLSAEALSQNFSESKLVVESFLLLNCRHFLFDLIFVFVKLNE